MKNRMDVPQEYEPVLPGKVEAHLAKKQAQETDQDSLLTQTAIGIGKVIMQLELLSPNSPNKFDVRHLTPGQFQELRIRLCQPPQLTSSPASRKRASMIDDGNHNN